MRTQAVATDLVVRTRRVSHTGPLLDLLPAAEDVTSWVRDGEGLVGWGEAARVVTGGARRAQEASRWWSQWCRRVRVQDDVRRWGSGPVAFTSMAFADEPGTSVLVVPRVLAGRRGDVTWITEVTEPGEELTPTPTPAPVRSPVGLRYSADAHPVHRWRAAVAEAVQRIRAGELEKVVLARDLLVEAASPIDPRFVLSHLAARYPECWCFSVDGLVGATPEMLVRRRGTQISSRVLAGTTWPRDGVSPAQLAQDLLASTKDRDEHAFAVASLVAAMRTVCSQVETDDVQVLALRNVAHLATRVRGVLADPRAWVLDVAAALHPTAAVGGTPTAAAMALIVELETMERGRYAGPVGWVDASGDGELGLALRSAQLDGASARLFAGGGIVA
ncbi:MAG: isochorismate synthase, partial [Mycobacteriaceae bacterium]